MTEDEVKASRPARALWIEIFDTLYALTLSPSRPARALWIEISAYRSWRTCTDVEAREGLVD